MPASAYMNAFTLYDLSGSLTSDNEFRDSEARSAYYCQVLRQSPLSTKIIRMADWPLHPQKEPASAWLYFTSEDKMEGYIKFGSREPTSLAEHVAQAHPSSSYVPNDQNFVAVP